MKKNQPQTTHYVGDQCPGGHHREWLKDGSLEPHREPKMEMGPIVMYLLAALTGLITLIAVLTFVL